MRMEARFKNLEVALVSETHKVRDHIALTEHYPSGECAMMRLYLDEVKFLAKIFKIITESYDENPTHRH